MFHTQKNICSSWLNLQQHQAVLYIFCYKKKEFPKVFPQSCVRILSTPGCGSTVFICPTVSYIEAPSSCSLFEVALVFSWVSWCKEFLDRFSFWHLSDTCSTIWQWRDKIHQRDQWQGVRFDRWHLWQLRPSTMSLVIVVGGERMPAFTYIYTYA